VLLVKPNISNKKLPLKTE